MQIQGEQERRKPNPNVTSPTIYIKYRGSNTLPAGVGVSPILARFPDHLCELAD